MYLWILAAVAAYFIKGLCGFANTLVFTSILSFGVAERQHFSDRPAAGLSDQPDPDVEEPQEP